MQAMSQARWETDLRVEVLPAAWEQEPVLANLLELYAHDFSELRDLDVGEDGRFGYGALPLYWTEPGRFPFLVGVDGRLAGLVLVRRGSAISGDSFLWCVDTEDEGLGRSWRMRCGGGFRGGGRFG